jgi:hypothetical protein
MEEKRPTAEQMAKFKKNSEDKSLSAEIRAKFKAIVDKFSTEVKDVEGEKPKATRGRKPASTATTKKPSKPATPKTKQTATDVEKAKAEIKAKTGKTEAECESIIEQYRALRTKAQEGKRKAEQATANNKERVGKLETKGDIIEGTNEKTADAVIESTAKDVAEKIEKQIEAVEAKAETEAKAEVAKDKTITTPKAKKEAIDAKVEKKVAEKTKTIVKRVVIDTSALLTSIATSLGKFDKDSQKEFLIKLRSDIDKLLSKYAFGGLTDGAMQVMNVQQSNMSSSSVNPSNFGKGGGVDSNDYSGKYVNLKEFLDSNKGMEERLSDVYNMEVITLDELLDSGDLDEDAETIKDLLRGKGYSIKVKGRLIEVKTITKDGVDGVRFLTDKEKEEFYSKGLEYFGFKEGDFIEYEYLGDSNDSFNEDEYGREFLVNVKNEELGVNAQINPFSGRRIEFKGFGKGGGVDELPYDLKKKLNKANTIIQSFDGRPITEKEAIRFNTDQMPQSGYDGGLKAFRLSKAQGYEYAMKRDYQRLGDALIDISRKMSSKDIYATGGGVKTNSKEVKQKIRQHILDSVYDYNENEFDNFNDASQHLSDEFKRVADYPNNIRRYPNNQKRFTDYLQGIPFNFYFYDADIEDFLNGLGINPKGKKYTSDQMWDLYSLLIWREIEPTYQSNNFEDGGMVGQEIVFDYQGEDKTGVIKEISNSGDYIVSTEDGRTLLAQRDRDVISLGKMREKAPMMEAKKKRFGFFGKGGGIFGEDAKLQYINDAFASYELQDELRTKLGIDENSYSVGDNVVISFAYTDYGGDFLDKVAIAYFKENYPDNIISEYAGYNGENAYVFGEPAQEWIDTTDNYPLGFEDIEDMYYEMTNEAEYDSYDYFLADLERDDYVFDREEVMQWLMENKGGYYSMTTTGLDFSYSDLTDELIEEGLISKEDEDEDEDEFAQGGMTEHGLMEGDEIKKDFSNVRPNVISVMNDKKVYFVDLDKGERYKRGGITQMLRNRRGN